MTSPVPVPAYSPAPPIPDPNDRANYNAYRAAHVAWVSGINSITGSNMAGLATSAATNALSAQESAISAAAAAAGANVELWDSSQNDYPVGRVVKSPAALAAGAANVTYICKVATGSTHTDPYIDSAHWSIFTVSGGVGGAIYTTSTTLNSSSPFSIQISGGAGAWIKLPDAMTVAKGLRHTIYNGGANDIAVQDSTGANKGWLRPRTGCAVGLSDNSTAAGKWSISGLESQGITLDVSLQLATTGLSTMRATIALDSTRTLLLYGTTSIYAAVYDTAIQSLGTPVLVRSGIAYAAAIKSATDQVLVVSNDSSTALQAVTLATSGTAITVNTAATATLVGAATGMGQLIAVGTSFVVSYLRTSQGCVRAMSISAGAVTIGAESSSATAESPRLYAAGSVLRTVQHNGSAIVAIPYTVSGSTLTLGTQATAATACPIGAYRSFQNGLGNIVVMHANGGNYVATFFKLTTTTEAAYSVNTASYGTFTIGNLELRGHDCSIVASNKLSTFNFSNSDFGTIFVNCVVDNNGSASAGTAASVLVPTGTYIGFAELKSEVVNEFGFNVYGGSTNYIQNIFFDCSGTSPVRTKLQIITGKVNAISGSAKSALNAIAGQFSWSARGLVAWDMIRAASLPYPYYLLNQNGVQIPYSNPVVTMGVPNFRGENDQSTYYVAAATTAAESSAGIKITRVECV